MSQRERSATRESLIEVARLMVERDGEPALTLGAVADEAGLARATVYGFFSGRNELLEALDPSKPAMMPRLVPRPKTEADEPEIWANCQPDLASFLPEEAAPEEPAEPVPSREWVVPPAAQDEAVVAEEAPAEIEAAAEPVPSSAWVVPPGAQAQDEAVVAEEAPAGIEAAAEEEPAPAPAEEPPAVEAAPAAEDTPFEIPAADEEPAEEEPPALAAFVEEPHAIDEDEFASQDERRRLQASHLEEIAKRLILPESALKHGTDAVIARLDTRIRVLEKSITGLETRQAAADCDAPKRLRAVTGMVEQLQARADTADGKQLQAVSELRLSIHQLETRLGVLEGPGRAPIAADWPMQPVDIAPVETAPDAAPDADAPEDAEAALSDNPRHAYLSTVRSIAKEGARQAEERESAYEVERQSRRRRTIAAACVAVVSLGVVGVLFLLRPGAHGVSTAQSRPQPAAMAALAPLDRLSALAQKGDDAAELLVGLKYLQSNDTLAARWLARAAGHNNAIAENALGALYQSGRGVKADLVKAAALYEASAAQGNRHAMSNLAVLRAGADEQHRSFADAARWFQRSASLGYVDAQFNLAVLYERGDGVPQSLLDAYKWYTVAARSGDAVAKTRADAIATQLSPDELAAAQKAVAEYKPAALDHAANDVPAMATVLAAR